MEEERWEEVYEEKASVSFFAIFVPSPWHLHGQINTQQEFCVLLHWLNGCGGFRFKGRGGGGEAVPYPDRKDLVFFIFQARLYRVCRAAHHHDAD